MAYELRLVNPAFASRLTATIIELDHLRKRKLGGSVAPWYFFQIKEVFHWLESLGSARIEGNHTTIADYIEHQIDDEDDGSENIKEIQNITRAIEYVEQNTTKGTEITHRYIYDIHSIIVEGLSPSKEGDRTPGTYRTGDVTITGSKHVPNSHLHVLDLMGELLRFTENVDSDQYDLIKIALFHHRFTWIHPFSNGNGRVVRMLNYALLIKYGFNVKNGRILNPSCVFFNDREYYYEALARADNGTDKDLLFWCDYVIVGISNEIVKIDDLLDYSYLSKMILQPAIHGAIDRKVITKDEADILMLGVSDVKNQSFKASDIDEKFTSRQKTHMIKKLKDMGYIRSKKSNSRTYYVNFSRSHLLRGVIQNLKANDFIQESVDE